MTEREPRFGGWPWVWGVVLAVPAVLLPLAYEGEPESFALLASTIMYTVAIVLMAALSTVLRIKVPGSPFGWLLYVTGLGLLLSGVTGTAIPDELPLDPSLWTYAAVIFQHATGVFMLFYFPVLMLYLFPTGHFVSWKGRLAGWFGIVTIPSFLLVNLLAESWPQPFAEGDAWALPNPIGVMPTQVVDLVTVLGLAGLVVVMIGGVVSIVVRYRRSGLVERAQIKWLMYPGILFVIAYVLIATSPFGSDNAWWAFLFVTPFLLIPIAITVAITRYRLFEIDRLISRTVSYAIVVGLLALVFVAGVTWLPSQLIGEQEPIFVAASTLAVAALFNPVRVRVQRLVDRRFNRSAIEADRLVQDFTAKLQGSHSVSDLAGEWEATVEGAMEPESIGVWLKTPS
jgi:hypothetical protein